MSENLNKALDNILKKHGKGSVLQGDEKVEYERIPTGSLGLDIITGGGYPIGRFVEVYAPESSGKTTVAIHGMIQAQKKYPNKRVAIIDAEHAFDRDYAEGLGLKMDEVLIVQPDCIWEEEMVMNNYGVYHPLKKYEQISNITSNGSMVTASINNGKSENDIGYLVRKSIKNGFNIRTGFFEFIASSEHRVKTFNGYKKVKDLIPKKDSMEVIYKHDYFRNFDVKSTHRLSRDLAFLLGCFIGDGNYNRPNPRFYGIDDVLNQKILKIISENFKNTKWEKEDKYTFRFSKKENLDNSLCDLKLFLDEYLGRVSKKNKYIPHQIFSQSEDIIKSFIAGLIMTDGSVSKSNITFSNYSKNIIMDFSSILNHFAVPHYINKKNKNGKIGYEVCINNKEGIEFFKEEVFLISYKKDKLDEIDLSKKESFVRFPKEMWEIIYSEIRKQNMTIVEFSNIFHNKQSKKIYFNKNRGISNEHLIKINDILKSELLQSYIDSDVRYVSLKEIVDMNEDYYMNDIHVETNNNFICNGNVVHNCGEQGLDIAADLIESGEISMMVIDSIAALTPKKEIDGDIGDSVLGLHARLMSQACRVLTSKANKSKTVVYWTNQLREKIGVMFGSPETTPGGNAMKFYASIRIDLRKKKGTDIDNDGDVINSKVTAKTVKNKTFPPFRSCEFDIIFGEGIDLVSELLYYGEKAGIIKKSGSWYSYDDVKLGQGSQSVKSLMRDNPEMMEEIENKIKEYYKI